MKSKTTKTEILKFRCTPEEKASINQLAKQEDTTESNILYQLIFYNNSTYASSIMRRHTLCKVRNLLLAAKIPKKEKERLIKELERYDQCDF